MTHAARRIEQTGPRTREVSRAYASHVNPKWVGVLDVLGMNVSYTQCRGVELETEEGMTILDFLSGRCAPATSTCTRPTTGASCRWPIAWDA